MTSQYYILHDDSFFVAQLVH